MIEDARQFYAPQPRAIAKAAGLRQYFPGQPCPAGHVGWWRVVGGCVECANERKRQWVRANPDRAKAYGRAHYEANADAYKQRARWWKAENPERAKVRYKPDPIKRRAAEKARRAADPEKYRAKVRSRKAQRRGAEGVFTAGDVTWIFAKQRGRCAYCRARLVPGNCEVDHIRPVIRGGSNYRRNLQLTCVPCNRTKGAKDPIDFARKKGLLL